MDTRFYCSCGHIFSASEVRNALQAGSALKQKLIQQLREMDIAEQDIHDRTSNSLHRWIYDLSFEVGNLLGISVIRIRNAIRKLSF